MMVFLTSILWKQMASTEKQALAGHKYKQFDTTHVGFSEQNVRDLLLQRPPN